jgi:hypothetical protein
VILSWRSFKFWGLVPFHTTRNHGMLNLVNEQAISEAHFFQSILSGKCCPDRHEQYGQNVDESYKVENYLFN